MGNFFFWLLDTVLETMNTTSGTKIESGGNYIYFNSIRSFKMIEFFI